MSLKFKTLKMSTQCLVWVVATGIWLAPGCLASETGSRIQQITPMEEVGSYQANIRAEDYFDVVGTLDLVENDRVIIGNRELTIAPGVNTSQAQKWNLVGVQLNQAGEVVVFETVSDEPN